jgi:CheY-like chemotaxis protein
MRKRVLVVDDEPDVVTYICSILEDNGFETATAADGEEAMKKVLEQRPDCVTLDISMPHTSGVRFYRWLKESPEMKDIPVIIVTGISDDFKRFISTRRQVPPPEGYLSKPIEEESLLMLVRALCDRGESP